MGRTALHIASGGQHTETVQTLLENGASIQCDINGRTPDMLARKNSVLDVFKQYGKVT